jgi:uncharacterized damage-inducible protein DinB
VGYADKVDTAHGLLVAGLMIAEIKPFHLLAAYNAWANRRIYEAVATLPTEAYMAPRPAFFGSIHRTLNHILVGDRVWLSRIEGTHPTGPIPTRLDEILFESLPDLRDARAVEDQRIIDLCDRLASKDLGKIIAYRDMAGNAQASSLHGILLHFFNHQTHHRGQVHNLLSATTIHPPSLDMIILIREIEAKNKGINF